MTSRLKYRLAVSAGLGTVASVGLALILGIHYDRTVAMLQFPGMVAAWMFGYGGAYVAKFIMVFVNAAVYAASCFYCIAALGGLLNIPRRNARSGL